MADRDYKAFIVEGEAREACYVAITDMKEYKNASAFRAVNPQFKEYDYEIWKDIIDVFAMRVSCLFGSADTLEYVNYSEKISPYDIYVREENDTQGEGVFILSAFPEFLVDYFGQKLWRNSVRHKKNRREQQCL